MTRYRTRVIEVEAEQYQPATVTRSAIIAIARLNGILKLHGDQVRLRTFEGWLLLEPGDWVIKLPTGDLTRCKPDLFNAVYERVED